MKKIYYDKDGFICEMSPYRKITADCKTIEITEERFESIRKTKLGYGWRYNNGTFENVKCCFGEEEKVLLRRKRDRDCFPVINRGQMWHSRLTDVQKAELKVWYDAWLNVTDTLQVPTKPAWLN